MKSIRIKQARLCLVAYPSWSHHHIGFGYRNDWNNSRTRSFNLFWLMIVYMGR